MLVKAYYQLRAYRLETLQRKTRLKEEYGIRTVTLRNIHDLPTSFMQERRSLLGRYEEIMIQTQNLLNQQSWNDCDEQIAALVTVFLQKVITRQDFAAFVDLLAVMPWLARVQAMEVLLGGQCLPRLHRLLIEVIAMRTVTKDIDVVDCGHSETFGILEVVAVPISTTNEWGITCLDGIKKERRRLQLATDALNKMGLDRKLIVKSS